MSLIVNSPITLPVVAKDVPTPISGTRGLVAKYDGWYDYQSDGTETKIPSPNDNLKFVNGKGVVFGVPDSYDPESVYKNRINNNGIEMAVGGGETHIEVGKVEIVCGDKTHNLSEKANTADVFLKSGDVVIADGKKISFDGEPYGYGLTLGKNGITIETVNENEYIDTVSVSPSEVTVTKYDSAGNDCVHKLSEKANSADVGTLSDLATADKSSIVAAINEVKACSGDGDVLNNLTYDSTNDIINSSANLFLADTSSVAAYNGTFRGDIKVGQLGANKWAYTISPITGFSTSVDVTCTSGNKIHSLANKADSNDVLTKTNTAAFTPTGDYQPATKKYVDDIVIEAGGGDMLRTVYDKDKTGTVDDSKKLGGQLPSYYSKATDIGTLADLNTTNKTNIVSAVNEKWTGKVYTIEVGNDWEIHTVASNGEEKLGSYYQEIAVEGITSAGQPFVDVVLPDDDVQAKQQLIDYQCVSRVRTENGKIILKCFEDRPSSSFTIRVLVLGNTL